MIIWAKVAARIPQSVDKNIARRSLILENREWTKYTTALKIIPISKTFTPNVVIPPSPITNACINNAKNETKDALHGPNIKTTRGMMKKCIGMPIGDGIVKEVATTVIAVRTPVITKRFSISVFLKCNKRKYPK